MQVVEAITVARGIDDVWEFVSDRSNDPAWCSKVKAVHRVATDRWQVMHRPVSLRPAVVLVVQQLAAEPPTFLKLREEDEASVFEVEYQLQRATGGGTLFVQNSNFAWKKLPRGLHRLFAYGVRRDVRAQMRQLKRVLETT